MPPAVIIEPRVCSVDRRSDYDQITRLLAEGKTPSFIETWSRGKGVPVKAETIRKHIRKCIGGESNVRHAAVIQSIVEKAQAGAPKAEVERDFAIAVQRKALEDLAEGNLNVSTKDGLVAQQLIDKRAERARDRAFVLDLARLISGAGAPPPPELIEGEFVEVDMATGLLAPPEVRDDGTGD